MTAFPPHDDRWWPARPHAGRSSIPFKHLNRHTTVDVGTSAPAKQILAHIDGLFRDPIKICELATKVDVLTVEIEHIDVDILEEVQAQVEVHRAPSTIRTIEDKYCRKVYYSYSTFPY